MTNATTSRFMTALAAGFPVSEKARLERSVACEGFVVEHAPEAIDIAHWKLDAYSLIIVDLSADDPMGGISAIEKVKSHPAWRDIPVLVLSSSHRNDILVDALNAGADDYLFIPYSERELGARVRSITRYVRRS